MSIMIVVLKKSSDMILTICRDTSALLLPAARSMLIMHYCLETRTLTDLRIPLYTRCPRFSFFFLLLLHLVSTFRLGHSTPAWYCPYGVSRTLLRSWSLLSSRYVLSSLFILSVFSVRCCTVGPSTDVAKEIPNQEKKKASAHLVIP